MFKQLFDPESCTYTYLISDDRTSTALLIDPVDTQITVYLKLLEQYGLTLKYSLETHVHADHITGSGLLRQQLGCKTAVSVNCGAKSADIQIVDGDIFELSGNEYVKAIATPGHTAGSISFLWRDRIFTGDALLINGCGRTDFQGGDSGVLYDSITQRIFTLDSDILVYPGHDYTGHRVSSIHQELNSNKRLAGKSRDEFIEIMHGLNLPMPKLIDIAVPAILYCGTDPETARQAAEKPAINVEAKAPKQSCQTLVDNVKKYITEVTVEQTIAIIENSDINIIDVREESEVANGYIENSHLIPRGVLEFKIDSFVALKDKSKTVLLYCHSGNRSALAAVTLQTLGYTNVLSMAGGYQAWKPSNTTQ